MDSSIEQISKDALVVSTMVSLAKAGDFLQTVEWNLDGLKRSGAERFVQSFGGGGQLKSRNARSILKSHLKRFEIDMSQMLRFSVVVAVYTLFESRVRSFIDDFNRTCPGKPNFDKFEKTNGHNGFVLIFRRWLEEKPNSVTIKYPRIWSRLDDFRHIRNCIAHANGELSLVKDKNKQKLKDAIRRSRNVRFEGSTLALETKYPFQVLERVDVFFQLLFSEAGYRIDCPPGYSKAMSKHFAGFEKEMMERMADYYREKTL